MIGRVLAEVIGSVHHPGEHAADLLPRAVEFCVQFRRNVTRIECVVEPCLRFACLAKGLVNLVNEGRFVTSSGPGFCISKMQLAPSRAF